MTPRRLAASALACLAGLATASCASNVAVGAGGSTGTTTGSTTATDAGSDAGYLACMDGSGQIDASLKACQSDADCVVVDEQTDCCGTILHAGIAKASAAAFAGCEAAWVGHFPGCGCASNKTSTEDGKTSTFGSNAGAAQVHCIDFTMSGGVCMSYTP